MSEAFIHASGLSGHGMLWGAATALAALVVFGLVVGSARHRGIATACMCFGPNGPDSTSPETLVRIALLGAGVALALVSMAYELPGQQAPLLANVVAGGCVLVGCVAMLDLLALASLFRRSDRALVDDRG